MIKNQKGFIHLSLLLIALGSLLVVTGVGFTVYKKTNTKKATPTSTPSNKDDTSTKQSSSTPTGNTTSTESKPSNTAVKPAPSSTQTPTSNTQGTSPTSTTNNNPTIKINSPANNATVGGNPSFSITSSTPGGFDSIYVSIYFNDSSCQEPECVGYEVSGNAPEYYPTLNFTWDTDSNNNGNVYRRNGSYTIEAEVTDSANKKASTSLVFNLQR